MRLSRWYKRAASHSTYITILRFSRRWRMERENCTRKSYILKRGKLTSSRRRVLRKKARPAVAANIAHSTNLSVLRSSLPSPVNKEPSVSITMSFSSTLPLSPPSSSSSSLPLPGTVPVGIPGSTAAPTSTWCFLLCQFLSPPPNPIGIQQQLLLILHAPSSRWIFLCWEIVTSEEFLCLTAAAPKPPPPAWNKREKRGQPKTKEWFMPVWWWLEYTTTKQNHCLSATVFLNLWQHCRRNLHMYVLHA